MGKTKKTKIIIEGDITKEEIRYLIDHFLIIKGYFDRAQKILIDDKVFYDQKKHATKYLRHYKGNLINQYK